jgi:quercetin dioxygenase-like cupin family protein
MDKDILIKKLKDEDFTHVYEWHDEPNTEYPAHVHRGDVSMYIVDGGLTICFGVDEIILNKGDRFDVPVGKEHTAKVGPNGCTFIVGEMIEGDS